MLIPNTKSVKFAKNKKLFKTGLYIITVTYNNRWATLMSMLKQLEIACPDAVVVIVNNGSDLNLQPD